MALSVGRRGQGGRNKSSLHATVFGQLSNQRCVWFDDFSLTESHLPTVMGRESALEAYRSPGADCLHRRLEARLLLGVKCLCVCVFCMNTNVLVNAHPSVSLCMTHVGMWNTVNFRLCVWVLESSGLLSLSSYSSPDVQSAWSYDTSALLRFSMKSAGTKGEWVWRIKYWALLKKTLSPLS